MEISVKQSNHLKVVAILMMLCLHLFNRDYKGLFEPSLFIGKQPVSYYISLFCDACVPIFAFVSGYGLYYKYQKNKSTYQKENFSRIRKLYINYWIIILIFPLLLGTILQSSGYPGSWTKFFENLIGFDNSYNGAWWFFTTYILFVLSSEIWFKLLQKINIYIYIIILFAIYVFCFYLRIHEIWKDRTSFEFLNVMLRNIVFFFCTLFQFMLGAIALKYNWNTFVSNLFKKIKFRTAVIIFLIVVLIVAHAIIPNFIIAPFTGLCFIFLFCQFQLNNSLSKVLDLLVPHSTNMWLIHMFFYITFFPEFIYSFKYPVIIFFVLVLLCVGCSYIINVINNKFSKVLR